MAVSRKEGGPGLGVSVTTGLGDRVYPVYIKRDKDWRISEAKIVFC